MIKSKEVEIVKDLWHFACPRFRWHFAALDGWGSIIWWWWRKILSRAVRLVSSFFYWPSVRLVSSWPNRRDCWVLGDCLLGVGGISREKGRFAKDEGQDWKLIEKKLGAKSCVLKWKGELLMMQMINESCNAWKQAIIENIDLINPYSDGDKGKGGGDQ